MHLGRSWGKRWVCGVSVVFSMTSISNQGGARQNCDVTKRRRHNLRPTLQHCKLQLQEMKTLMFMDSQKVGAKFQMHKAQKGLQGAGKILGVLDRRQGEGGAVQVIGGGLGRGI